MPEWLTVAEASALLGIPKNRLYADFKKDLEYEINDSGLRVVDKEKVEAYYAPIRMLVRHANATGDTLLRAQAALILEQADHIGTLKDQIAFLKHQLENYIDQLRIAHEDKNKILEIFRDEK